MRTTIFRIIAIIVLVIGGFIAYFLMADSWESSGRYTVKYIVLCDDCDITYTNETGGTDRVAKSGDLWEKIIVVRGDQFISLIAQNNNINTDVNARIEVNGKPLGSKTSNGQFSIATVTGRPQDIHNQ